MNIVVPDYEARPESSRPMGHGRSQRIVVGSSQIAVRLQRAGVFCLIVAVVTAMWIPYSKLVAEHTFAEASYLPGR